MESRADYLIAANDSNLLDYECHRAKSITPQYTPQRAIEFIASGSNNSRFFYEFLELTLLKEQQRLELREITLQTYVMLKCRLNGHVLAYFGGEKIHAVNPQKIQGFIGYLQSNLISAVTIKQYLSLLRRVLSYAVLEGSIASIPEFPKIKSKSTPRGSFTVLEYKSLLSCAKELALLVDRNKKPTHRNTAGGVFAHTESVPTEMRWLIGFMVNTFVRPVDIKLIKNKHIQIVSGGDSQYLRLAMDESKRHKGVTISMRAAVNIYRKIFEFQTAKGYGAAENYVFFPQVSDRNGAIQLISNQFRKILNASHLRIGVNGECRTLYSLRHTAITFRLLYGKGIDLLTLARNARTSVEMIERFYSSNLTPEMNVALLQSKRTQLNL